MLAVDRSNLLTQIRAKTLDTGIGGLPKIGGGLPRGTSLLSRTGYQKLPSWIRTMLDELGDPTDNGGADDGGGGDGAGDEDSEEGKHDLKVDPGSHDEGTRVVRSPTDGIIGIVDHEGQVIAQQKDAGNFFSIVGSVDASGKVQLSVDPSALERIEDPALFAGQVAQRASQSASDDVDEEESPPLTPLGPLKLKGVAPQRSIGKSPRERRQRGAPSSASPALTRRAGMFRPVPPGGSGHFASPSAIEDVTQRNRLRVQFR